MHDPAVDRTVSPRGLTLHYREYTGPGRPIVLLHGLASTSRIWLLVGPLLGAEFHTVALDQRGSVTGTTPSTGRMGRSSSNSGPGGYREAVRDGAIAR